MGRTLRVHNPTYTFQRGAAGGAISILQIRKLRATKVQVSAQRHYFLPEARTTGLAQPPVTSLSQDLSTVLETIQNYFVEWCVCVHSDLDNAVCHCDPSTHP